MPIARHICNCRSYLLSFCDKLQHIITPSVCSVVTQLLIVHCFATNKEVHLIGRSKCLNKQTKKVHVFTNYDIHHMY